MGYGLSRCKGICIKVSQRDPNGVFCKTCNHTVSKDNCYVNGGSGLRCTCCKQRGRLKSTRNSGLK